MQNENQGRVLDMAAVFASLPQKPNTSATGRDGKTLFIEPRTIRHQERVVDLFYLLFRRTGA